MEVCTPLRTSTTIRSTWRIWIQIWRAQALIRCLSRTTLVVVMLAPNPSGRRTSTRRTTCSRRWSWRMRLRICAEASSAVTLKLTSKQWVAVTTGALLRWAVATRPSPRKVPPVNGQPTETSNSWAWTVTRTHLHPSVPATRWLWTTRPSNIPSKSNQLQAVSTSSSATQSEITTKALQCLQLQTVKMLLKLTAWWAWSSRRQTSMSSPPRKNHRSKTVEFLLLACPATHTTTRWIVSALRSPSAKISTLSFPPALPTRVPNSRHSTTSWSRRSCNTTKWWVSRAKTARRCWTHAGAVASLTSCSLTTNRLCTRILTMAMASSCRVVSRPRSRSTRLITTNMSTVYRATRSTPPQTSHSSRIERTKQRIRQFCMFGRRKNQHTLIK